MTRTVKQKEVTAIKDILKCLADVADNLDSKVQRRQSRMAVDYILEDVPPDQQELVILENKVADLEAHNDMLSRSCKKLCDNQDALKKSFATDKFMLQENHVKEKQSLITEIQKLKNEICRLKLSVNNNQAKRKSILNNSPSRSREEHLPRAVYILRYELRAGQDESETEIMGVFPDVESANKAAVTAYKRKCENWESLPITDVGVSEERPQDDGDDEPGAQKWRTGRGEVRYSFSEGWKWGHGLVSVERHIVGGVGLENEDNDSDLPYHLPGRSRRY